MILLQRAVCALLIVSLCGCASLGTDMADFDIDGTASLEGYGVAGRAETVALIKLKTAPPRLSPFHDLRYEGTALTAEFRIDTVAMNGQFTNRSATAMQLRFDQATMSSNLHPQEVPLLTWGGTVKRVLIRRPSKHALVNALPMALQPGEVGDFTLFPSYRSLYPSRRLFGAQFEDNKTALLESGAGNSLRLRIPVEQDGKRYSLVFELKARQARARRVYF